MKIDIHIPGTPKPKQSFRFAKIGNFVRKYQPEEVKQNERSIKMIVQEQLPPGFTCTDKPISILKLHYLFPPLKTMKKAEKQAINDGLYVLKHTKPDVTDNLAKSLFDSLQGIIYNNDSQICSMVNVLKAYSNKPGIKMTIHILEDDKQLLLNPLHLMGGGMG